MKKAFAIAAVLAIGFSANALNLKEKKQLADWQTELKEGKSNSAQAFKTNCGYSVPVTLDDKMVTPFMEANSTAVGYCEAPVGALSSMCKDATAKTEITKKIKKISCKLGKEKEATFKMSGTELVFTVGLGASNLEEKATKFFETNL